MTTTPVMALPNFDMKFDVETDASTTGVGGALQQNRHLIAFISKELGSRWANLSVYEKELLAVFAVQKWGVIPVGQGFHYQDRPKEPQTFVRTKDFYPLSTVLAIKAHGFWL